MKLELLSPALLMVRDHSLVVGWRYGGQPQPGAHLPPPKVIPGLQQVLLARRCQYFLQYTYTPMTVQPQRPQGESRPDL